MLYKPVRIERKGKNNGLTKIVVKTKLILSRICTSVVKDAWSFILFIFLILYRTKKTWKINVWFS